LLLLSNIPDVLIASMSSSDPPVSPEDKNKPASILEGSIPTLESSILNVNVGVLGHVDSGKTSLVKALSTLLSTAALDKSTQSRQRGMTLDLGFSCFFVPMPTHLQKAFPHHQQLQITLVDCPGHASLIRTIIGGAQIIDLVLLVVDAVKGWQAQTTECLVLAELCSPHLVVALNKIDSFPEEERDAKIEEARKHVQERLLGTRFALKATPMVSVSACVGGEKAAAVSDSTNLDFAGDHGSTVAKNETMNIDQLVMTLKDEIPIPNRIKSGLFYFAIDHCFPIRGRGTVVTGTCLSGSVSINNMIEFPTLALERKVKSMQMFKRLVTSIVQGDRAGICVSNFDSGLLERGIAASPGAVQLWKGAIAIVRKVPYYNGALLGNSKFHISVGHTTVMATLNFWGARELATFRWNEISSLDPSASEVSRKGSKKDLNFASFGGSADMARLPRLPFDFNQDYEYQDGLLESLDGSHASKEPLLQWAILDFQTPVHCPIHCLVIGSRLDSVDNASKSASSCRLAFSGRLIERIDLEKDVQKIRLFNTKEKHAIIAKLGDPYTRGDDGKTVRYEVFGSNLFKKETNMKIFIGMKLLTCAGDIGEIKSSFGTAGDFRVFFPAGTEAQEGDCLVLRYKRFLHDVTKSMHQDFELPDARTGTRIEVAKKKTKKLPVGVSRVGVVDSIKGDTCENGKLTMAIISGFFAPEVNIKELVGTTVVIPGTKEQGLIVGPFGKAGKCKVSFEQGIAANVGEKAELCM
jgi:selenocysteine-specific elongation factor